MSGAFVVWDFYSLGLVSLGVFVAWGFCRLGLLSLELLALGFLSWVFCRRPIIIYNLMLYFGSNLSFIIISYSNVMHSTEYNVKTFSEEVL